MTKIPQNIIDAINKYTRKFYIFEVIRGFIIFTILTATFFLIVSYFNYFFYPALFVKRITFYLFISFAFFFFYFYVLKNLLKLFSILPKISTIEAAKQISRKLPEIKDYLINILELASSNSNNNLILESIKQKSKNLKFTDFSSILKFKQLKYFFYSIITFIFLIFLLYNSNKNAILTGTKHFINYNTYYSKPSPFNFQLLNKNLQVFDNQALTIKLKVSGNYLPNKVYIIIGDISVPMKRDNLNSHIYTYTIKKINKSFKFLFKADDFFSKPYTVKVLSTPKLNNFYVDVIPPSYTNLKAYKQINNANLIVPYGSKLNFTFNTSKADSFFIDYIKLFKANKKNNVQKISFRAFRSSKYTFILKNLYTSDTALSADLQVVEDLYPKINLQSITDSNNLSLYYFIINISDDYGFNSLKFKYAVGNKNSNNTNLKYSEIPLNINRFNHTQSVNFMYDFKNLNLNQNDIVYFYFEVADNDYFNSFKKTKTPVFTYMLLSASSVDSLVSQIDSTNNSLLNQANELATQITKEIEDFKQKLSTENITQWEKENFLNDLLNKQNKLNQLSDSINKLNQKKITNLQNYTPDSTLLAKQKQIQDLLNKLLTPEIKQLLDSLQQLLNKKNNQFKNVLNTTENKFKQYQKNIETTNELLKRMYLEQKVNSISKQLNKLSKQTDTLSNNINKKKDLNNVTKDSISEINKKLQNLKSEYDSLMNFNSQLKKPYSLQNFDSLFNSINENLKQSQNNLQNNKIKKTNNNLKNASQQMQQLSQMMNQMMQANQQNQNAEDLQTIKFILTNLLQISFKNEKYLTNTPSKIPLYSKLYSDLILKHKNLYDEYLFVRDSLNALSNRNPMAAKFILDEVNTIDYNYSILLNNLYSHKPIYNIFVNQRNIIESLNRLSLIMQESMNNIQNMSSSSANGSPQSKPSSGNGIQQLQQMQQSIESQLQNMIQSIKNGKSPSSEELAKQLAQQEAFQKMLQDMIDNNELSQQASELLKQISKMNQEVTNDLINNNITPETLNREHQIKTKLLESEKAELNRKFSNKRKSHTSQNIPHSVPDSILIKFKNNNNLKENLINSNIKINSFYKNYYNEYIHKL